jgi:hypothetical protein
VTRRAWLIHPPARSAIRFVGKVDIGSIVPFEKKNPRTLSEGLLFKCGSWSVELIVQPNAHDVEVGTATPMKHETSIALSVRYQSLLRLTASLFALGPELPTLLTM